MADSSALPVPALSTSELLAALGTFCFHVCPLLANDHSRHKKASLRCLVFKQSIIEKACIDLHSGASRSLPKKLK